MRIASFILPLRDNAGADVQGAHNAAQDALLTAFGGFTGQNVFGAWRDESDGKIYRDDSVRYEIGADWNPANRQTLEDLASAAGHLAGQICVAVTHSDGRAVLIDCEAPDIIAARALERSERQTSRRALAEQYGDIRRTA
jgi:hypothetical protein